jgi:hypothetical protein
MLNRLARAVLLPLLASASAFAGVSVTSPASGATVSSPAHFVASASSSTSAPIASMMIYVDNKALYTVYSNHLDTSLSLSTGAHTAMIKSWNSSGTLYTSSVSFNVGGSPAPPPPPTGNVFSNIDQMTGWGSCSACAGKGGNGPVATMSMAQNQSSPSMDGNSMKFSIGGNLPYADALWYKHLGNPGNARHFVFDLYFYITNPAVAMALEFDVNVAYNGRYYVFGNQCNPLSTHTWDVYDKNGDHWVSTGVACPTFAANQWNHVTIELERTTSNQLHFVSFTYNGAKHYTNKYFNSVATSYSNGVGIDYQMDSNSKPTPYSTWVDKMSLTYY